jgi:hypothetical protein
LARNELADDLGEWNVALHFGKTVTSLHSLIFNGLRGYIGVTKPLHIVTVLIVNDLSHIRREPTRLVRQAIFASCQALQYYVGKCRYNVTFVDNQGFRPV